MNPLHSQNGMVLLGWLIGDPGATNSGSVPINNHVICFALLVPNERQPYVIRGAHRVYDETRFAFRKEFRDVIPWQAPRRCDEMASQFIRLVRNTERRTKVDQPKKQRLPVLSHKAVVDRRLEVD